jgi:prepilin-type N-terminal cleavage/methylation domain-containing protein
MIGPSRRTVGQRGLTLLELLIAMTIMAVLSTMLIATWVALAGSFAHTTRSSDARDYARQAASRMERELRDAEAQVTTGPYKGRPAVLWASANEITFVTTFNRSGNDAPNAIPVAVRYYLDNGTLYMQRDSQNVGAWGAARTVVPHVVNGSVGASGSTPVFSYTYVADDGSFVTARPADDSASLTEALRARIVSVSFTLLVDMNPGHSPAPMTLITTAQLRNQRWF